ncbi:MAG: universal stress protein, partial [Cytophagia bacterium]|nr:universal stress protein [Cytophagia bacterium]
IVLPNTLHTEIQEDLLMKIKAMQNFFKATLHIVWINTPSNFTRDITTHQRLQDFAKRFLFKNYTIHVFNDLYEEDGIINFAHSIKADMIAMGTHGRKGLAHILSGSVAEDVVNHIDIPIWTYTMRNE